MALRQYARKRDFSKTPEPPPRAPRRRARSNRPAKRPSPRLYVIQKHDATRLHYDLRLELDGVLKSWAVPKGPSLDPADKRLAVQVEDHPIEYGRFEGTIPKGQYGGGTVLLWDVGRWTPLDPDPARALRAGRLKFRLEGRKLHGQWTLARIRGDGDGEKANWLLIKHQDESARKDGPIVENEPLSVKTGRTLADIAAASASLPKPRPRARKSRPRRATPRSPIDADIEGAIERPMPRDPRPQLCTPAEVVPAGGDWVHELKFDGYRVLALRGAGAVRLLTRSGKDWTHRFRPIADAVALLDVDSAIIDGEATILDSTGRSSFQELQRALKHGGFERLAYFVFDLLYCNGRDLTRSPLLARKALLQRLLAGTPPGPLRYSDHIAGHGSSVGREACRLGMEGIISKRADAVYVQARAPTWLKIKCGRRQEFIIVGHTDPSGARRHFGSLLLAAHDAEGRLVYTGRVGTGFDQELLAEIARRLAPLARRDSPLDILPPRAEVRGAHWAEPRLVAEIAFTEWTGDGRLRHPAFQGLREDKEASAVRIEKPDASLTRDRRNPSPRVAKKRTSRRVAASARRSSPAAIAGPRRAARSRSTAGGEPVIAGVTISSPDRVLFPEAGITKLDLARYHERVAELILPHLVRRPLSTVRCPSGRGGPCFFQKHLGTTFAAPVRAITIQEDDGPAEYISINSIEGLITLVQFGVLEMHPWGSRRETLEKPDRLTFDLDPGDGVTFADVKAAARRVREVLAAVQLESFLKTSGGKGLHVVVPLVPEAGWDRAKAFAAAVARRMATDEPSKYVDNMSKKRRHGRIFVDYLRNGRGATSVAPYSPRARPSAPVSMPISWEDLARLRSPDQHTVGGMAAHLKRRRRDPWARLDTVRQKLPE